MTKWIWILGAALAGVQAGRFTARLERLEILNQHGAVALSFEAHRSGAGMLTLHDAKGAPAVQISAADGGRLSLSDPRGEESVYVGPLEGGHGLWIGGPTGTSILLKADPSGQGRAILSDGAGRTLELSARPAPHALNPTR